MMKYQLSIIFLVLLLFLFALVFYVFRTDYIISTMVAVVWVSVLLLRSAFPRLFTKRYVLYVVNFLVLFALLNTGTLLYDKYLDYKLAQFDINHDSVFSLQEQTPEQQYYMTSSINDVGRNFIPITGLLISLGSTILLFFVDKLLRLRGQSI